MNYPFQNLAPDSRIWIFLSSRSFSADESKILLNDTITFVDGWLAHKQALKAGVELLHNQFLIIAVDESMTGASGCSIDKLHHFIRDMEQKLSVELLNRMRVVYKNGNDFFNVSIAGFQKAISSKEINNETIIFNTLISTLREMNSEFEIPVQQSWMNRYLVKTQV